MHALDAEKGSVHADIAVEPFFADACLVDAEMPLCDAGRLM